MPTRIALTCCLFALLAAATTSAEERQPDAESGLRGGLVVQIGAADVEAAIAMSRTGRYLIHVLDADADVVAAARQAIREQGRYGFAWAEQRDDMSRLPYAENVVNRVWIRERTVPAKEIHRVLTPGGAVLVTGDAPTADELQAAGFESIQAMTEREWRLVARKPWPESMDQWSHPRHEANGNAVSGDLLVGPPRRVRWVAAATSEVEGMVSAGGRNFYGGVLARDSFNGLRLWHRGLRERTAEEDGLNRPDFLLPRLPYNEARPIASRGHLFAVLNGQLTALDSQTGEVEVRFAGLTSPSSALFDGERVIAADGVAVAAYDVENGEPTWKIAAAEPRNVIADGDTVAFISGNVRRGDKLEAVAVDAASGKLKWRQSYPWLRGVTRTVLFRGLLVFELSTFNDHDAGNGIHVADAATGRVKWSKEFAPGMNHRRQARAMFIEEDLWILHGGKVDTTNTETRKREPTQISAIHPETGEFRRTLPAGLAHCFPPVATPRFMFTGELDLTNLDSGEIIANRITKANCSPEFGWVPANGLVYTTPKHCTCWPMLRGYVAMAPAAPRPTPADLPADQIEFALTAGPAKVDATAAEPKAADWPLYRRDRWRSSSTPAPGPQQLEQKWVAAVAGEDIGEPTGPIEHDWAENPIIKGPLTAPVIANGLVYVARPDAHELLALDEATGKVRWRFTANGRVDTPPAIHRGLCLFGSAAGWVYALRADTGEVVWRLRAAPSEERIVAYGQVESPWPVPGAVLVMDDIAYFAAGRQPLADGGILVFAVDPRTGQRRWVRKIDSVPQQGFYENSGLEFDPFDILHAEGENVTMSRWVVSRDGEAVSVDKWNAFAQLDTGGGPVWVPRGAWTYGARHQHRFRGEAPRRPLIAFRDGAFYSSLDGTTKLFRRDFRPDEKFDSKWITGWSAAREGNAGGTPYRNYRLVQGAKWAADPFAAPGAEPTERKSGQQLHNDIFALALAGDELFAVHQDGRLKVISTATGEVLREKQLPPPLWDGLAIANGRAYLALQDGRLICLGK